MNFRNNFYPSNNVYGEEIPTMHNQMQRNIRPGINHHNIDPYHNNMQQFVPNSYNNYYNSNMQMQDASCLAYENNYRTPSYSGNRDNQYNRYYDNTHYGNWNRSQQRNAFKGYYDRYSTPIREARSNLSNSSRYNAVDDEYYNYDNSLMRKEDSKSFFRNNFFTRLSSNNRRRSLTDNNLRDNFQDEERFRKSSGRCKPVYEDEYDDYEDDEDFREERRPRKLKKRCKPVYEDEYDDYEDGEDFREERRPRKLKKRCKPVYEDECDDYEDDEDFREERRPRKLKKRCKPVYEDEYDDYEDDDRLVERKSRFTSGPINFFKKKKRV